MTGIICARYKDELFMFADGRVTEGDFVLTDKDDKIVKIDDLIVTMCGDSTVIEPALALLESDTLDHKNILDITGYGIIVILSKEGVTLVDIDNSDKKEINGNGISKFKLQTLPMFFGSGERALSGAFFALDCLGAKSRKEFVKRVSQCYDGACKYVLSMGPLQQVESIKLDKVKT